MAANLRIKKLEAKFRKLLDNSDYEGDSESEEEEDMDLQSSLSESDEENTNTTSEEEIMELDE